MLTGAMIQAPAWCPMCWHPGMGRWGMIGMVLVWAIAIAAVVWLVSQLTSGRRSSGSNSGVSQSEAILKERYARGEIDTDTYSRMLAELRR